MASNAAAGVSFIAVLGSAIYLHFWVNPKLVELNSMFEDLNHSHENRIKALEARIMDSKAENAELKIALDPTPSQGKV